jgi:N-acetyl-anhydromuramyl-L-alanine amidase AmpD
MAKLAPTRKWKDIYFVTIHHDAVKRAKNMKELESRAKSYNAYHKKKGYVYTKGELGYKYISYHYLIAEDGSVLQVQPLKYARWHAGDNFRGKNSHNLHGIAICLSGNFQNIKPTQAQLEATADLIADLEMEHDKSFTVRGHRDTAHPDYATACPGVNLANKIRWIIERVNYIKKHPNEDENKLKKEIKRLESLVKDKNARIKQLDKKIGRLDDELTTEKQKVEDYSLEKEKLENKLSKGLRDLDRCLEAKNELENTLNEKISILETSLDSVQAMAEDEINKLERQLALCRDKKVNLEGVPFNKLLGEVLVRIQKLILNK